jgi:hypothetical protein
MFSEVRIGQPLSHGSLTVFPLFREHSCPADAPRLFSLRIHLLTARTSVPIRFINSPLVWKTVTGTRAEGM